MENSNLNQFTSHYQIFVKNLRLAASIGIYPGERQARQDILVSVILTAQKDLAAQLPQLTDSIDNLPSYEHVVTQIKQCVADRHIDLVEQLAIEIADKCFNDPRIMSIEVMIAKPDIFPDAEQVGCVYRRKKSFSPSEE